MGLDTRCPCLSRRGQPWGEPDSGSVFLCGSCMERLLELGARAVMWFCLLSGDGGWPPKLLVENPRCGASEVVLHTVSLDLLTCKNAFLLWE